MIYNAYGDEPLLDNSPPGIYGNRHVRADGRWHSFQLRHGVRTLMVQLGNHTLEHKYQYRFGLRPWQTPEKPVVYREFTSLDVMFHPNNAECYVDGNNPFGSTMGPFSFTELQTGRHEVHVRWPDGRERKTVVDYERRPGKIREVFLNPDLSIFGAHHPADARRQQLSV